MADKLEKTIQRQVYAILRKDISTGKYKPGQHLQESELAKELGVSRSPVRETLKQLVSDGLAISVPHKGVYVKEFTIHEINEIFDVRLLLETYSIRNSKDRIIKEKAKELFDIIDILDKEYSSKDLDNYITADLQLHKVIISLCGNSLIENIYKRINCMNQQFRIYSLSTNKRFNESIMEHKQIVNFLLEGKVEEAIIINEEHLRLARGTILAKIKKQ